MGGPSAEREVSLSSGIAVATGLREAGYNVTEMDVRGHELDMSDGIEAVFVALHGEFGEDGQVQLLLDRMGIPYTGSGSEASRLSFDKEESKTIFVKNAVQTPEYEMLCNGDERRMLLPVVVKPACQGSTIGVHRVMSERDWPEALSDALSYGSKVVVEAYIRGRELTVGIVGNEALPVIEIVTPEDWYDYRAKYTKGLTRYLVPAPIDKEAYRTCQETAVRAFEILGCRGFARVDIRVSENDEVHVLELNTIPGFTETSLLPKAAANSGMKFSVLCDRIMNMACTDGNRLSAGKRVV